MAACWLVRTPLEALYFNLSWALIRRHPPLLRDEEQATHFGLPISTRLIRNGFVIFNRRYLYAAIHWAMENSYPYARRLMYPNVKFRPS